MKLLSLKGKGSGADIISISTKNQYQFISNADSCSLTSCIKKGYAQTIYPPHNSQYFELMKRRVKIKPLVNFNENSKFLAIAQVAIIESNTETPLYLRNSLLS